MTETLCKQQEKYAVFSYKLYKTVKETSRRRLVNVKWSRRKSYHGNHSFRRYLDWV